MSYDDWKTTDQQEKNWRECKCGEQIYIPDCLKECPNCGYEFATDEPDPDRLYDEWRDRQFEDRESRND